MKQKIKQIYIRPGVLFWKSGDKYFFFDQISLEQYRINQAAYQILLCCNGKYDSYNITENLIDYYDYKKEDLETIYSDVNNFLDVMINKGYLLANVNLNQLFLNYVRGKEDKANFIPGLLYWEVTNACNRKCVMCYNPSDELSNDELTYKEGLELITKLHNMGTSCIIFTGGEPLIRHVDVIAWIKYCTELGIQSEMFTNGTLITKEIAGQLKEAGLGYCRVSIHGAIAETHDYITQVSGSFELATKGISYLVDAGIKTAWSIVANKRNFKELRNVIEEAIRLQCHGVVIGSLDLIGRGALQKELELEANQEAALWRFVDESIYYYGNKIRFSWGADMCKDEAWDYYVTNPESPKENRKFDPNYYMRFVKNSLCGVGQRSFAVTANGNITPCPALYDIILGNIRDDDIKVVWESAAPLIEYRKKLLEDFISCGTCGMRYACVGGCRANAFHSDSSLLGKDLRRCKVHVKRGDGKLDMSYSFYTESELNSVCKTNFRSKENELQLEEFNTVNSEGQGPWIPYIGIQNRINNNKEKNYDYT